MFCFLFFLPGIVNSACPGSKSTKRTGLPSDSLRTLFVRYFRKVDFPTPLPPRAKRREGHPEKCNLKIRRQLKILLGNLTELF